MTVAMSRRSGSARLAPQTRLQAWVAFFRGTGVVFGGLLVVWSILALLRASGLTLRLDQIADLVWISVLLVAMVPLVLIHETWVLIDRLRAFRRGEIHLEDGEMAAPPAPVHASAASRRRVAAAERALRRGFRWRMLLIGALWLACAGATAGVVWLDLTTKGAADPRFIAAIPAFLIVLVALVVLERADLNERLRALDGGGA